MIHLPNKRFYMMRHGKTISNAQGYVAGALDVPLIEEGREEARRMSRVVRELVDRPRLIVHSHLGRARDTAAIVNEGQNLPLIENPAMAERSLGDWTGIPLETWIARRAQGLSPPNGETTEALHARVLSGLAEILKLPEQPVLVVSHGGVIRGVLLHFGCEVHGVKNCGLYEFVPPQETSSPWQVWMHGLETKVLAKTDARLAAMPKPSIS